MHTEFLAGIILNNSHLSRSPWPRGPRHELYLFTRMLGSWIRILVVDERMTLKEILEIRRARIILESVPQFQDALQIILASLSGASM